MSQIIHGPPKIWGPGQLPDLTPLKLALYVSYIKYTNRTRISVIYKLYNNKRDIQRIQTVQEYILGYNLEIYKLFKNTYEI